MKIPEMTSEQSYLESEHFLHKDLFSDTLLAKKVVTPRDDVSFCDYFYFISPRGLRTGCLV